MSFPFQGFVLRPPRVAPSNAVTTAGAASGVVRDFQGLPAQYTVVGPTLVDAAAEQYKAAILLTSDEEATEYLLWSQNTSNLTIVEGFEVLNEATGRIVQGTGTAFDASVPIIRQDASDRVVIADNGNRSILEVIELEVVRGDDTQVVLTAAGGDFTFDPRTGIVTFDPSVVGDSTPPGTGALGGGVSRLRGDRIQNIKHTLAASRFWWTKNDKFTTRFTFNGRGQRWEPIRGAVTRNLGELTPDGEFVLSPQPGLQIGDFLPGDSANPDSYSMVRLGTLPGANESIPVAEPVSGSFGGIQVVADDALEDFDFGTSPTLSGVIGLTEGTIKWNPAFIEANGGQVVWYSNRTFVESDTGDLGRLLSLKDQDTFLSPIPGPTDFPFLSIGSRNPLEPLLFDTDAELNSAAPGLAEGQVGISLSTGRVRVNATDIAKADPDDAGFDIQYLGNRLFYNGVSLTQVPMPVRAPVRLLDENGQPAVVGTASELFVPRSTPLPSPGISGVMLAPDGTGDIPNLNTTPAARPNGSGLVRQIESIGDTIVFTESGVFDDVDVVDTEDDLPQFPFKIRQGRAVIAREQGAQGSKVLIGTRDRSSFAGEAIYFLQADVTPSVYYKDARFISRRAGPYTLAGDEVLAFAINGNLLTWDASTDPGGVTTSVGGTFTADDIATSLQGTIGNVGEAVVLDGRVTIQTVKGPLDDVHIGEIEIGYGPGGDLDLSGAAALGFLPGWRVKITNPADATNINFVPDSGAGYGLFRSPANLNRALPIADFNHRARLEDEQISESVMAMPVILLDNPPLEDEAGYDEGVFFAIQDGLLFKRLDNFEEVYHQFKGDETTPQPKFSWADTFSTLRSVTQPTSSVDLGRQNVIADTVHPVVGGGLLVSEDGESLVLQERGTDFLLDQGGLTGQALLIEKLADLAARGGNGAFTAGTGTFTDGTPDLDFQALGVTQGYRLKVTSGDAQGYYTVDSVPSASTLEVTPAFLADANGTASWELYEGKTDDEVDPAIVADQFLVQFNHLPGEVFIIKQIDPLGEVPATAADQSSNRLSAVVTDAVASNRPIEIRFGLPSTSPTAQLVPLTKVELGVIANGVRFVPGGFSPTERFKNNSFSVRVGTRNITFGSGDLIKISDINDPVGPNQVGVLASVPPAAGDGELKFGDQLLAELASSPVFYVEEFSDPDLAPTDLPEGTVEYKIDTGELNFSAPDLANFGGFKVNFVEQLITEGQLDVTISPINGGFTFNNPLRTGQIVEATYFQARESGALVLDEETGEPVKVIEFLPRFVRLEKATPVPAEASVTNRFAFNPDGNTVRQDIEPQVFVRGNLRGFLGDGGVTYYFDDNNFDLNDAVNTSDDVEISYAVIEAAGGETAYSASTPPVYRPPFFIDAGVSSFTLDTDRSAEFVAGKFLRVGATPMYVTGSSYDAENDTTVIEIFPPTVQEAGSRSPGNDVVSALSTFPVATAYSPDAKAGFFTDLALPFDTITRGATKVIFLGDATEYAVPGHLLEIDGTPFIISGVESIDGGRKTQVDVTTPTQQQYGEGTSIKISVRPVYQPNPRNFLGQGAVVPTEPFELVLFGETDDDGNELPGRSLRPNSDYTLDDTTGSIEFVEPVQSSLLPGQTLWFRGTRLRTLTPFISDDVVILPRYQAGYSFVTVPDENNGYLEKRLLATYSFSNPDSFYLRAVPLETYLPEVAEVVSDGVSANSPSSGPALALAGAGGSKDLFEEGNVGLEAQLQDLEDQDRAARSFLSFYNESIVAFEQVLEAINGFIIGDRDGKFRFYVGRGLDIAPPGFEDPFSGRLNARNLYVQIFLEETMGLVALTSDPIVDPNSASISGNALSGNFTDSDTLQQLIDDQKPLIQNDIDDVVLIGRSRTRARIPPFFFPKLVAFGRYRRMATPSVFSRLFPEEAKAFTLSNPGIGADLPNNDGGIYARRKAVAKAGPLGIRKERRSTTGKTVANIANPVLDVIEDVQKVTVGDRKARARIWAYSRDGFPDLDAALGTSTAGLHTIIATPLLLKDFPVDATTGLPDVTQLQSQGGDLPDLDSGDPDLFTPPFTGFDGDANDFPQVAFGNPDGTILDVGVNKQVAIFIPGFSGNVLKTIFVKEVQAGCAIVFTDDQGSDITSGDDILVVDENGDSGDPIELERGDTIFVVDPDVEITVSDPPTTEELNKLASALPGYRVGFDVELDGRDGQLVDKTWRSFSDPSLLGFKELFGQKPPRPLTHLEMDVRFRNSRIEPVQIPALTGDNKNDDGDFSIPYLAVTNTEIERLNAVQPLIQAVLEADTPEPGAEYPDEILGVDGQIFGALTGTNPPSVLISEQDFTPVASSGNPYVPGSAIGDVDPFDLLLVEKGQPGVPGGLQGILNVGIAAGNQLAAARFVSPTQLGGRVRYEFENCQTFVNQPVASGGLVLSRGGTITSFDGTGVPSPPFTFNNGGGGAAGGFNLIMDPGAPLAYPASDNVIRIKLWRADTGDFLQTVTVEVNSGAPQITGDAGTQALTTQPDFFAQIMSFDTALPFLTISAVPAPGEIPEDPGNPGFSVPLWFAIDVDTTAAGAGSLNAVIGEDRLTFFESYDLRTVLDRSSSPVDGVAVRGSLRVTTVEGPTSIDITSNAPSEVNGGTDFTFENRSASFPFIGVFAAGIGAIRVPSFEGFGNSQIALSGLNFSAMPSSPQAAGVGQICTGTGFCESETVVSAPDADAYVDFDNRVANPTTTGGNLSRIQPGDLLVIKKAPGTITTATTKAGTYLVRHVIEETNPGYRLENLTAEDPFAGSTTGFARIKFPTLVSSDVVGAGEVVISDATGPIGGSAWPGVGRLYFIRDRTDITQTISIAYFGLDATTGTFNTVAGTGLDHLGAAVADAVFDAADTGILISGFRFAEVLYTEALDASSPLPSDHLVGFQGDGTFVENALDTSGTAFGFYNISLVGPGGTESFDYVQAGGANSTVVGAPGAGEIGVRKAPVINNGAFDADEDPVVYDNCASSIDLSAVSTAQWTSIHVGATDVDALFPGDQITAEVRLQAAIFLEPSFPRPVQDLTNAVPLVVDDTNGLVADQRGFRSGQDLGILANPAPSGLAATPEEVEFEIRRVRRWHTALDDIGEQLLALRYAYEIRRGVVTTFGSQVVGPGPWPYVLQADDATQLGAFDLPDVNINSGDRVRLLDADGKVIDEAEVASVVDGTRLMLASPGFSRVDAALVPGLSFQIYLNQAPVPHEQSNEQLLTLMTDEVVLERTADYATQDGGFAFDTNVFQDKDGAGLIDFVAAGVRTGDILLIDPQGAVEGPGGVPTTGQEFGTRPFGDTSVPGRGNYDPGRPSELDDNRGFYRVTDFVGITGLSVSGKSEFTGDTGTDVIFGNDPTTQYAVMPTVRFPGQEEGQQDLRTTAYASTEGSPTDSFKDNFLSIAPVSYRIIRPSSLFSPEAQDLILFMRERMLSWIEELGAMLRGTKRGTYFVFQRDEHVADLGDPSIPDAGLGVPSNALIGGLLGNLDVSPFSNSNDALSILDRRFWVLDIKLDTQKPEGAVPADPTYATFENNSGNPAVDVGEGRPVLPDFIDDVLNNTDQFRELRFSWIDFRVNLRDGTLAQIRRFEDELPRRIRERARLLRLNRSFGST